MNGVSLLILWGSCRCCWAGAWYDARRGGLGQPAPGALVLGLGTLPVLMVGLGRWRRAGSALLALARGTLAAALVHPLWPAVRTGADVGVAASTRPGPGRGTPGPAQWPLLRDQLPVLLTTAVVLALIGGLEKACSACWHWTDERYATATNARAASAAPSACATCASGCSAGCRWWCCAPAP